MLNVLRDQSAAIIRHLASLTHLSSSDRELLALMPITPADHRIGHELLARGAPLDEPRFVLSGWICRAVSLPNGSTQILDFYIPGDLIGYSSRPGTRAKVACVCLTEARTTSAAQLIDRVRDMPDAFPGLSSALTAIEEEADRRLADQIVRLGAMSARERVEHLIHELHARHQRAGLSVGNAFSLPLSQTTLADALGLSVVHVNRTLQQLRREGIIRTGRGQIELVARAPGSRGATADRSVGGQAEGR